eukprot:TRINITY_DN49336_c0_g1_i1.p1 TRINITY_DN49336_c0_g1~~TRINITY_DN49336_c0_g1_i1.p1  ORF type:complete len:304 (-),score=20.50 TRINITY_DN49336_c0_g1_i1:120-1031(-)
MEELLADLEEWTSEEPQYTSVQQSPSYLSVASAEELSHAVFTDTYRNKKCIKLCGLINKWEACSRWQHPFTTLAADIANEAEPFMVLQANDNLHFFKHELCTVSEDRNHAVALSKVADFAEELPEHNVRYYLRLPLVPQLKQHISLPGFIEMLTGVREQDCSATASKLFKSSCCTVWISPPGCITPLHYDFCHGFLAQVTGKKLVTLFPPSDFMFLYPADASQTKNKTSSRVDIQKWLSGDAMQRKQFPKVEEATCYQTTLCPGEVLYIPPYYWHSVETLEPSVSVLLPTDPTADDPVSTSSL